MATKRHKKLTKTRLKRFISQPIFQRIYGLGAVVILAITTIFWALIGSWTQAGNADQLANSFLTESGPTFNGAVLPDQHTFLLKLPFFWLVQLLGGSPVAFSIVTVLVACLTVGLFAFILYKIQPRPLVLGTLYLGLALVLMMIPAEPYSNALLPTNMAMLTTRNLEYIVLIAAILLTVRAGKWRSFIMLGAVGLMMILVASDKLFLSLGIGGAVIFAVVAFLRRNVPLRQTALRWLVVSIVGSVAGLLLLRLLTLIGFIHVDAQSVTGPYGLIHSVKDGVFAVFYGVLGIFTNFGANAGFDSRTITDFPGLAFARLASPLVIAYAATFAIIASALFVAWRHGRVLAQKTLPKNRPLRQSSVATLILIATSIAALGAYVVTSHYYPVDARYLSIFLFMGFVALATFRFKKPPPVLRLVVAGAALTLALIPATFFVVTTYASSQTVSQDMRDRNITVAKTLALHPTSTLLGDYWRVLPIKSVASSHTTVTPLSGCTTNRPILTSTAWQPDLEHTSFAYLLTLNQSSPNFPACSLDDVTNVYGRPDSSVVIRGTVQDPQELLLFYDQGIHKTTSVNTQHKAPDTVVPVSLFSLAGRTCDAKTILSFVAHEDDDILFMNPDLSRDIQAGNCIRSVFLTAGDAGGDAPYWLSRQQGAEAAYASMLGTPDVTWTERVVETSPNHVVTVANPRNNRKISLIFLHLPDGNTNGRGFVATQNQSLINLYLGRTPNLQTVDKSSTYSSADLSDALFQLMSFYQPNVIRSQSAAAGSGKYVDHSDHTAVGQYVARAVASYVKAAPSPVPTTVYYRGYPIHGLPENVSGTDLDVKANAFLKFSEFDSATCRSLAECDHTAYGAYLRRQYTTDY